jgi:hypothetical protein
MRRVGVLTAIFTLVAVTLACQSLSLGEPTPHPTYTPAPTYTPFPTLTSEASDAGSQAAVFPFALTRNTYAETDALENKCSLALGEGWRLADWQDIRDYVQAGNAIESFAAALALEANSPYLVTYQGERWHTEQRHYLIEWHDHNLPDGWLSHEDINRHYLDLGSWFDLEASLLCYRGETAATAQQDQADADTPQTPETPPAFALSYYGSYPCGEWPNYAVFKVENTTMWTIQSVVITITDVNNGNVIANQRLNDRGFVDEGGCPPGDTILAPQDTAYVATNIHDPEAGTSFEGEITLCSQDGGKGDCASETVTFTFGEESEAAQPEGEPSFELEFAGTHPCGEWPHYAAFQVTNTSEYTFESVNLNVVDTKNEKSVYSGNNNRGFVEEGGCPPGDSSLPPDSSAEVAANIQSPAPGTAFEATIKLCTEDGVKGKCASQSVNFTFEE